MSDAPDVVAVNLEMRRALLSTGSVVPVTDMFDADGDETEELSEVRIFVCGEEASGWFTCDMREFEWRRMH